jgi:hypothetical protein
MDITQVGDSCCDRKLGQQYSHLYSWLVEGVSRLLLARHIEKPDYLKRLLRFYDGLRKLSEANTPLWIFSLNHDLIIELVAARLSIPIRSGLPPLNLYARVRLFRYLCTRDRGCSVHLVFPAPFFLGRTNLQNSGKCCRENADVRHRRA